MSDYIEFKTVYQQIGEDYHGGYILEEEKRQNEIQYLGGKKGNGIISRYTTVVVPFGLFYKNRLNDLHQHTSNILLENGNESECIEPTLFDRLFFAVGQIEVPKQQKYRNNNTRKSIKMKS